MLIINLIQKPKLSQIILFIIFNTIIFCKTSKCQFQPLLNDCTIVTDRQVIKPINIQSPSQPEHLTGSFRIIIEEKTVKALDLDTHKILWTVATPDEKPLRWLGTQANIAYFCKGYTGSFWNNKGYENPSQIYRLNLRDRKWIDSLAINKEIKDIEKNRAIIVDVLMSEDEFVTLSVVISNDYELISYCLMCFKTGEVLPKWIKSFDSTGSRPRSGASLLTEYIGPTLTRSNIQFHSHPISP